MTDFKAPAHMSALTLPRDLADVVLKAAEKEGRSYEEQVIALIIAGAECGRLHK